MSSNVVLTAAHCVVDLTARTISSPVAIIVRTGAVDRTDAVNTQTSGVSRIVVDPLFNTVTLTNDAALLQLATPTTSLPDALAQPSDIALLTPGTPAAALGWGLLDGNDLLPPTTLHYGFEYVQSPAYCSAHDQGFASSIEVCAIDPSGLVTICHGDSGGPLLAERSDQTFTEIGIISRPTFADGGQCDPLQPSVFTRVDAISAWASSWITALAPVPPPAPPAPAPTPAPAAVPAPAPTAAPTPVTATPATPVARHFRAGNRRARTWMTLSADGTRVTEARVALRVTCRGSWYADFDDTWTITNGALAAGRTIAVRFPAWHNRYWTRAVERLTVTRSPDGASLTVTPSVSARATSRRLGLCRAQPPSVTAVLTP